MHLDLLTSLIPGPKMGARIVILAVLGLAALYAVHLLAMDWMKIRKGTMAVAGAAKLLLGKRDLTDVLRATEATALETQMENNIDWEKIFRKDPFECVLSLSCQLAAGAEKEDKEANLLYEFITSCVDTKAPTKLKRAYKLGSDYNRNKKDDYKKCFKHYSICPYSAKTMLKLISINQYVFG